MNRFDLDATDWFAEFERTGMLPWQEEEVSLERRAKRNSKQVKRRKKNKIAKMSRRRNRR